MQFDAKAIQGHRDYMEDFHVFNKRRDDCIAMVCDGHGGDEMSKMTVKKLPAMVFKSVDEAHTNIKIAEHIRNAIIEWGDANVEQASGSTITGVYVNRDTVFAFNVGDSRTCFNLIDGAFVYFLIPRFDDAGKLTDELIVQCQQTNFFHTVDHVPSDINEKRRINAAGGMVMMGRINGILSVGRAVGDGNIGSGMSHVPDVFWTKRGNIVGKIMIMSDGVSERFASNLSQTAASKMYTHIVNNGTAEDLVNRAYDGGSSDNITVATLKL